MAVCRVYVIQCKSIKPYPIKIGVSFDPKSRLKELQTGCPYPLQLLTSIDFGNRDDALKFESFAHKYCKYAHIGGEWFKSSEVKVNKLIKIWSDSGNETPIKKALKIENVHGSCIETEMARLKLKNHKLTQENESLKDNKPARNKRNIRSWITFLFRNQSMLGQCDVDDLTKIIGNYERRQLNNTGEV